LILSGRLSGGRLRDSGKLITGNALLHGDFPGEGDISLAVERANSLNRLVAEDDDGDTNRGRMGLMSTQIGSSVNAGLGGSLIRNNSELLRADFFDKVFSPDDNNFDPNTAPNNFPLTSAAQMPSQSAPRDPTMLSPNIMLPTRSANNLIIHNSMSIQNTNSNINVGYDQMTDHFDKHFDKQAELDLILDVPSRLVSPPPNLLTDERNTGSFAELQREGKNGNHHNAYALGNGMSGNGNGMSGNGSMSTYPTPPLGASMGRNRSPVKQVLHRVCTRHVQTHHIGDNVYHQHAQHSLLQHDVEHRGRNRDSRDGEHAVIMGQHKNSIANNQRNSDIHNHNRQTVLQNNDAGSKIMRTNARTTDAARNNDGGARGTTRTSRGGTRRVEGSRAGRQNGQQQHQRSQHREQRREQRRDRDVTDHRHHHHDQRLGSGQGGRVVHQRTSQLTQQGSHHQGIIHDVHQPGGHQVESRFQQALSDPTVVCARANYTSLDAWDQIGE
jgi:hypothetical protein